MIEMVMKVNENIFRAYDLRGIYGEELDDNGAYYIGVAFGLHIKNEGKTTAIVGHDNRVSSPAISDNLIKGITDTGINVIDIGLAMTPMFSYAREYLNIPSGIMITASHSPSAYNGMKVYFNEEGRIYGEIIQAFKLEAEKVFNNYNAIEQKGSVETSDMREPYINMIKDKIKLGNRKIKVVVDCGNGSGSIIAVPLYESLGLEVVPLFCDSDPAFPNHHPDPAVEENMVALKQKVVEVGADLGVGFDGDADRVGIVDENGHMVYMDLYTAIICRDLLPRINDKKVLIDIKCSKALEDEVVKLGGEPVYSRTGHSYMIQAMRKNNIVFGCELAGHAYFADEFFGYDDGPYAGLRLIRILSNTDKSVSALLDGINKYYATPEIIVKATDETKFNIVNDIVSYTKEKGYKSLTIDGVRVLFDDGWALVRASNTGPNLTMRFEAVSEVRLEEIKNEFEQVLEGVMKKY